MKQILLVVIIAILALIFLMLGLAITRIRKGRDLQSEVGENDEMKKRGLRCASDQFRTEEAILRGEECDDSLPCGIGACGTCTDHDDSEKKE